MSEAALLQNLTTLRKAAGGRALLAVVKSNAYGHHMKWAVPRLLDKVDGFAVDWLEEARAVRALAKESKIVLLSEDYTALRWKEVLREGFIPTLYEKHHIALALESPPKTAWISVETGMHRLSLSPKKAVALALSLRMRGVEVVMSAHLHSPVRDEASALHQRDILLETALEAGVSSVSLLATSGLSKGISLGQMHEWVRIGLGLWGYDSAQNLPLSPVLSLSAPLVALEYVESGETIGYDALWKAPRRSLIGWVAAGYADGVPMVKSGAHFTLRGVPCPVRGQVCMQLTAIDLTDFVSTHPPAESPKLGESVEIFGSDNDLAVLSSHAELTPYQVLSTLPERGHA